MTTFIIITWTIRKPTEDIVSIYSAYEYATVCIWTEICSTVQNGFWDLGSFYSSIKL